MRNGMLAHTVTLFNYDDENNQYYTAIINNVLCMPTIGTAFTTKGDNSSDSADLYIFEEQSVAVDKNGNKMSYIPFSKWNALEDKTGFWTLKERDYFAKGIINNVENPAESEEAIMINSFRHFDIGTKRMRHWEIYGH